MRKKHGFTQTVVLIALAVLIITLASGAVALPAVKRGREKKVTPGLIASPTQLPTTQPTPAPGYQIPTPTSTPKQEVTFPTQYSCNTDSDCVLKKRPFCCGEMLQYYNWCYHKNVEPEAISCKGVGSCPGIVGSAKSCVCQNGKCTAIF